jgi:hypothetical protein
MNRFFGFSPKANPSGLILAAPPKIVAGVATVDIVQGIDDRFDEYEIHFTLAPATDNVVGNMTVSTDYGVTWLAGTTYKYAHRQFYSNAFTANVSSAGAAAVPIIGEAGNAAGENCAGVIHLYNPRTLYQKLWAYQVAEITLTPHMVNREGTGQNTTQAQINGVRLQFSSGNIAYGNVRLYGLARGLLL